MDNNFRFLLNYFFPKESGLETRTESFRSEIQILPQMLPIRSNSEVYRSASMSKCQEIVF